MVSLSNHIHQRLGLQKGKYILLSAHREENRWSSERNGEPTRERMQSRTCSSFAEREGGRQSQSLLSDIAESRQRKAIANIDTEKNRRTKQAQSQACLSYALQGGGNAKRNFLSLMAA